MLLGRDPEHKTQKGLAPFVAHLRAAAPWATLWVGIGCDGWVRGEASGQQEEAVAMLVGTAAHAAELGAKLVMWDLEDAGEAHPAEAAALGKTVVERVGQDLPTVAQSFTSFPFYTSHSKIPYAAWHGQPAVVSTTPQLYVGVAGGAAPGALQARVAQHRKDRVASVKRKYVPATLPWWWYLQLWGTPPEDTIAVALSKDAPHNLCFWSLWGKSSDAGREALIEICDRRRPLDAPTTIDPAKQPA